MTKSGRKQYLPAVRRLYYSLLADQIPPSKICTTVKMVLKCFLPNLNIDDLQLPKERCAGYMRADELATVSLAHKASAISEKAEKMSATLQQKKLMVLLLMILSFLLVNKLMEHLFLLLTMSQKSSRNYEKWLGILGCQILKA